MSIRPSHILGMNARYGYTSRNKSSAKRYGFSKLRTKELLREYKIPTAHVYHIFESIDDLDEINWSAIPVPFVVKPASGSAGKGIIIITDKKPGKKVAWIDSDGQKLDENDLSRHVSNILDGEYSTWGTQHRALIEEMITGHPSITKYAYSGTPDIRVIVFNSVPVMAMVRIPTKESNGRANLDKGAIALGVDMASGVTTNGIYGKSKQITHFPGKKKKVNGVKIPYWDQCLKIAVEAANAAGYEFMGADLFIAEQGPMIVELNGYPGLSIQLANRAGLKRRLERVEGLDVRDADHGVKISQALFAEHFSDQIRAEEGLTIIPYRPSIKVYGDGRRSVQVEALVNTGRSRSAISEKLAERLGLVDLDDLLWRQNEKIEGKVPVVEVSFSLKGRKITTAMVVTKRLNRSKHGLELGRRDTQGFLVGDEEP